MNERIGITFWLLLHYFLLTFCFPFSQRVEWKGSEKWSILAKGCLAILLHHWPLFTYFSGYFLFHFFSEAEAWHPVFTSIVNAHIICARHCHHSAAGFVDPLSNFIRTLFNGENLEGLNGLNWYRWVSAATVSTIALLTHCRLPSRIPLTFLPFTTHSPFSPHCHHHVTTITVDGL